MFYRCRISGLDIGDYKRDKIEREVKDTTYSRDGTLPDAILDRVRVVHLINDEMNTDIHVPR